MPELLLTRVESFPESGLTTQLAPAPLRAARCLALSKGGIARGSGAILVREARLGSVVGLGSEAVVLDVVVAFLVLVAIVLEVELPNSSISSLILASMAALTATVGLSLSVRGLMSSLGPGLDSSSRSSLTSAGVGFQVGPSPCPDARDPSCRLSAEISAARFGDLSPFGLLFQPLGNQYFALATWKFGNFLGYFLK